MIEGIIITIIGGLFLFFFGTYFRHRSEISTLKADNSALIDKQKKSENENMNVLQGKDYALSDLREKYTDSQKNLLILQSHIKPYEDREVILADYKWNDSFQTWHL